MNTTEPTGSRQSEDVPELARAERRKPTEQQSPPAADATPPATGTTTPHGAAATAGTDVAATDTTDAATHRGNDSAEATGVEETAGTGVAGVDDLGVEVLGEALRQVRAAVATARFTLATPGAAEARQLARQVAGTLDDYLLPRLADLRGPLLVVVCGPTGAGKSTLVNSLVRAPVSPAGVLRPTTRAPVLVANPADAAWFGRPRLLATFARTGGTPPRGRHLQVVAAPALPPGVALLDAPDIDSVVADNRELADDLMSAADAWLFVTTANRYADETPWRLLHAARDRDAGIAVVLDRTPEGEGRRVRGDLLGLLTEAGLGTAPLFELAESTMDNENLLPEEHIAGLRDWLARLAADAGTRGAVARRTLDGAVAALPAQLATLRTELAAQHRTAKQLRSDVRAAHTAALSTVDDAVRDGGLFGGELAARWQEMVGSGELVRAVQSRSGRLRDQLLVSLTGRALPGQRFVPAARTALGSLIDETLTETAHRIADAWRAGTAGAALLSDVDTYDAPDVVRGWFDDLDEWVRTDAGQRSVARQTEYTIAAVRLLVLVAVLVAPARTDATGSERAMLDTVLADPVVRRIAGTARDELIARFRRLADAQRKRYDTALNRIPADESTIAALTAATDALVPARTAAALVTERLPLPPATPPPPPPVPAEREDTLPGPDSPLFHPAESSSTVDSEAAAEPDAVPTGAADAGEHPVPAADAAPDPAAADPGAVSALDADQPGAAPADAASDHVGRADGGGRADAEQADVEPAHADCADLDGRADAEPADAELADAEAVGTDPADAEPADAQHGDAAAADAALSDAGPTDTGRADAETADAAPASAASADPEPADADQIDGDPTDAEQAIAAPADAEPADVDAGADAEPADPEPADVEPPGAEPGSEETADAEQAGVAPVGTDPVDARPTDAQQGGAASADADPASTEPADPEPAAVGAASAEPEHAEQAAAVPAKGEQADAEPGKAEAGGAEAGEAEAGGAEGGEAESGAASADQEPSDGADQEPVDVDGGRPDAEDPAPDDQDARAAGEDPAGAETAVPAEAEAGKAEPAEAVPGEGDPASHTADATLGGYAAEKADTNGGHTGIGQEDT